MGFGPPQHWSIKSKSVALCAGYVMALSAVYAVFSVGLLQRDAETVNDRLNQTAQMIAARIDAYISSGRERLTTVAELPGLVFGLRTIREAKGGAHIPPWTTLHYLFFRAPVFSGGVFLLDHAGRVVWTEPPGLPWLGNSWADYALLAPLYAGGMEVVSDGLTADALTAAPHVVVARAIRSPSGELVGVLGGVIDLTGPDVAAILAAASTTQGRFVAVLDARGRTVAATNGAALLEPFVHRAADDEAHLVATIPLHQAAWRVVAGQPRTTALAQTHALQTLLQASGAGLLLIAAGFGALLVRRFVPAIETLTQHAQIMAHGDLSQPVLLERPRHDELATLAGAFEQMRAELQRSQVALQQRLDERDELMRVKEEFLANVSHELRTPLNVIMGYADMLLERGDGIDERDILVNIRNQSEHLFSLVCDLMTLAGLNTGRISLELGRVRVSEVLARLKPLVGRLSQGRDIRVVWEQDPDCPPLETDPLRLEQILGNLITNAFKFTPDGTITVRAGTDGARNEVVFEVADTGIGIPTHELPHIFDEFRQVDGSMSRDYGGIGLGLALVRKLTALLDGEVSVISALDRGSTFTVRIPLRAEPVALAAVSGR